MKAFDGVLIAGAGVVGLTAALSLARRGVPVLVLEAESELVREYRGSTFHPPTLEMLDELGVAEELIRRAVVVDRVQYRDRREGLIAELDMGLLKEDTRYPFRLQIDQYALAVMLLDRLKRLPAAEVRFHKRVTGAAASPDHATLTVETSGGIETFAGPYVVGADGGGSAVRRSLGVEFEGMTYPERYLTVFTTFDFSAHIPDLGPVSYVSDPGEWFLMLRSPDVWRVLFPTRPEERDQDILADTSIQARLRGIVNAPGPFEIVHSRLYKVHQRVAETYRRGAVLLAGDAAHLNNPVGGMGLNGGIHDAVNLAEKLARVWHGETGPDQLDLYATDRRRIALEHVQAQAHRNVLDLSEPDPDKRKRVHDELRGIARDPELARQLLLRTSMIAGLRGSAAAP